MKFSLFTTVLSLFIILSLADNACNDESDLGALKSHASDAYSVISGCAIKCLTGHSCTQSCIASGLGVSSPCAGCFADDAGCTLKNCALSCAGGASDSCKNCSSTHCLSTFDSCAGVSPPTYASEVVGDLLEKVGNLLNTIDF